MASLPSREEPDISLSTLNSFDLLYSPPWNATITNINTFFRAEISALFRAKISAILRAEKRISFMCISPLVFAHILDSIVHWSCGVASGQVV